MGGRCTVPADCSVMWGPKDVSLGLPSISSGKLRHDCYVGAGAAELWVKGPSPHAGRARACCPVRCSGWPAVWDLL